jgi:uncharacterized protein
MTVIITKTGGRVDLTDPLSLDNHFTVEDIAAGLSKQCRFNGQIDRFYSVAEHSVLVSRMVPDSLALAALMHDAAEAYLGDVVTPLKSLIEGYETLEHGMMVAISCALDFDYELLGSHARKYIKIADLKALKIEKNNFYPNEPDFESTRFVSVDSAATLKCLPPEAAYCEFIARFNELKES